MKFYFEEKHRRKTSLCHNCDTMLGAEDNFCRKCGQENHDLKVPITHIAVEVLESITHFDNKFFTTFKSLLTKPGQITKDFLNGKRSRFVPPLRLYFFISTVYFFLYSCSNTKTEQRRKDPVWVQKKANELPPSVFLDEFKIKSWDTLRLIVAKKTPLQQKEILMNLYQATLEDTANTYPVKTGPVIKQYIKQTLKELKRPVPDTILFKRIITDLKVKVLIDSTHTRFVRGDANTKKSALQYINYTHQQIDSAYLASELKPISWYERLIYVKQIRQFGYNQLVAEEKDLGFSSKLNAQGLNYSIFLLMPLVGLVLWLLFRAGHPFYYEHLIVSINIHAFLFLAVGIPQLFALFGLYLDSISFGYGSTVIFSTICVYLLFSLKHIYEQSWLKTILKTLAFFAIYTSLFIIAISLVALAVTAVAAGS